MTTTNDGSGTVTAPRIPKEFNDLCESHGVKPTRRQFSKWRNGYGALRAAMGTNSTNRQTPPGVSTSCSADEARANHARSLADMANCRK